MLASACSGESGETPVSDSGSPTPASQTATTTPPTSDDDLVGEPGAKPAGIRFDSDPTPVEITALPTAPPSPIFADSNQPAYDQGQGFVPDARRVLDLTSLQLSLLQYWSAHGTYPATLDDLFPDFAPLDEHDQPYPSPPVDPVTRETYRYEVTPDGQAFQLAATMDNGTVYVVSEPEAGR